MASIRIKVLDKAVQVIELLARSNKGVRLKEVAQALALNRTTALRILRALESHGLAVRNGDGTFVLGDRVAWWETCYSRSFELPVVVRPYLEKLRDLTSETAIFSILVGDRTVVVGQAISPHVTSTRYDLGAGAPLNAGASGKVLLAHLDPEKRQKFIRRPRLGRLTARTITDTKRLERQLKEIRAKGFAITCGERYPSTASVAVPIFGSQIGGHGVIAVVGPSDRLTPTRLKEISLILLREVRLLTKEIRGLIKGRGEGL